METPEHAAHDEINKLRIIITIIIIVMCECDCNTLIFGIWSRRQSTALSRGLASIADDLPQNARIYIYMSV